MSKAKQIIPLLVVMALLLGLFAWHNPTFLAPENLMDILQQISVNAIIAFGMTLTILIGGIDLSVGAVLALVGTTTVSVLSRGDKNAQSIALLSAAVIAGLCVAASVGLLNGILAARTRMPAFIITLSTMLAARGAAYSFNEARPIAIQGSETAFLYLGSGRLPGGVPVPVAVMLGIFVLSSLLLHRTRFGLHLYAIGGNREAARFTGIHLARAEIIVYLISAVLTGVAGMINVSQLYSAAPSSGVNFELYAIAACVVGGTSFTGGAGSMYGTLLGAILMGILDKGLNQSGVHFSIQYIVKGLVILTAVYVDVRRRR